MKQSSLPSPSTSEVLIPELGSHGVALGGAKNITELPTSLLPPHAQAGFSAAVSSAALGGLGEGREVLVGGCESEEGGGNVPRPEANPAYFTLRKVWKKHWRGGLEGCAGAQAWAEIPEQWESPHKHCLDQAFPPDWMVESPGHSSANLETGTFSSLTEQVLLRGIDVLCRNELTDSTFYCLIESVLLM